MGNPGARQGVHSTGGRVMGARRDALIAALYGPVGWPRARRVVERLREHLPPGGSLLDLGAGTGHTGVLLARQGWAVTLADAPPHPGAWGQRLIAQPAARHLARQAGLRRVLTPGPLPFPDAHFDTVLLAFVLHHCPDPPGVLREAARVARRRVLVLEDVTGDGQRPGRLARVLDALVNLEAGHPHAQRSHADWLRLFGALHLTVHARERWTSREIGVPTGHVLYDLRPAGP